MEQYKRSSLMIKKLYYLVKYSWVFERKFLRIYFVTFDTGFFFSDFYSSNNTMSALLNYTRCFMLYENVHGQ